MSAIRWALCLMFMVNTVFATQFGDIPASQVIGALSITNDTNVTLTLGGTSTDALLKPFSLTVGWTGTLSTARGGMLSGGTTGQVLKKNSNANFDLVWGTSGGTGTVTDFSAGDLSPLFTTTEATTTTTPALSFSLTSAGATTVFGRAAGTSGAPTYSNSPQFTAIGNLTTNGFLKTSGGTGTLSVDTATYQPSDADLTTWAGITPATGMGTWIATPSSANLRGTLTDENGTGAALFSGATSPDFTTGITIGGAAASRKILVGDGTKFGPSTETWPVPGTSGNILTSDGTNWTSGTPKISDTVFSGAWDGVTAIAPSQNAVYDYVHLFDTNDNGKVNVLDMGAGIVKANSSGAVSAAAAGVDYWDTTNFVASGASHAKGLVPDPGVTAGTTKFLREDATWAVPAGGGGSPGGANTNIQFNDGGVFGGGASLTWDKTNLIELITGSVNSNAAYTIQNTNTGTGAQAVYIAKNSVPYQANYGMTGSGLSTFQDIVANMAYLYSDASSGIGIFSNEATGGIIRLASKGATATAALNGSVFGLGSGGVFGWSSTSNPASAPDTGIGRNAAGVVEVNNGTAGSYRDLKCDDVDAVTGYKISGAAASGKILIGNGTVFTASTPTYPLTAGTSGNIMQSDGTNWASVTPSVVVYGNGSAAGLATCCATNTIIPGSTITLPTAGAWKQNGVYHSVFDMAKSAAGVAAIIINVHMGTAGTTSDAIVQTLTLANIGTAAVDAGVFDLYVTFKTVGSGTSAVIVSTVRITKLGTSTGLSNNAIGNVVLGGTSSGFNSTTQTKISIGFNGGSSFSGTNTFCQTEFRQSP